MDPLSHSSPAEAPATHPERVLFRYLEPAERLNEILFGLIMVLTFTLTAGLATGDGPEAYRELLIATIVCSSWSATSGASTVTPTAAGAGFAFLVVGMSLVAAAIALGG